MDAIVIYDGRKGYMVFDRETGEYLHDTNTATRAHFKSRRKAEGWIREETNFRRADELLRAERTRLELSSDSGTENL